jgi:DNA replication protein DnaC
MEVLTMLNNQTAEKLRYLKLRGMANSLNEQMEDSAMRDMLFEDRFGLLVDAEYTKRRNSLLQNIIKNATLRISSACMEDIDYLPDRNLDKNMMAKLSSCNYIEERRNVTILGATGTGKTYIGCALGNAACRKFVKVKYIRLPELLVDLSIARGDGTFRKVMNQFRKYELLILDEWLLMPLEITTALDLLEIVESRHENSSTIFISQSAPAGWHSMIGEGRIADAVVDRILHNSYEIVLGGDSMRLKRSFKSKKNTEA